MKRKYNIEKDSVIQSIIHQKASETDPDGSYTGKPENENEEPVQDADDL
ncbi:MAG: hypothetical protein IKU54_02520 [Oscillospiraceae bacterium]|nr:hypothetical protein [Oscillospiraceae bacterium]